MDTSMEDANGNAELEYDWEYEYASDEYEVFISLS
jgi:hypothetical protein